MKDRKEWPRWTPLAFCGLIACLVWFVLAVEILPATYNKRLYFYGDFDSVKVMWGKNYADSSILAGTTWATSIPEVISVAVDKAFDWDFVYVYYSGDDSASVGDFIKFTAGAATISTIDKQEVAGYVEDTLKYYHGAASWTTGGAGSGTYTVDIYVFDTLGGATTAVEGAIVDWRLWGLGRPSHRVVTTNEFGIGRMHTDSDSLAVRVEDNPIYIFPTAWDSMTWTTDYSDSIYGYLNLPAAATSPNYVHAYVDIGKGIIDSASGSMIPRTAIQLYLELIGERPLNDGSWLIIPTRYTAEPNTSGRANFFIPANTILDPPGSYYILSFRAYDGTQQITGELKRFIVDTIPDPILILDATETW